MPGDNPQRFLVRQDTLAAVCHANGFADSPDDTNRSKYSRTNSDNVSGVVQILRNCQFGRPPKLNFPPPREGFKSSLNDLEPPPKLINW